MNRTLVLILAILAVNTVVYGQSYPIVDTGQERCYDNTEEISAPAPGEAFYGQDAQFDGLQMSYTDNGDGTVTDDVTGLMWQQTPVNTGFSWQEAVDYCASLELAGYDDWRMPTVKELFSIGDFSQGWPYLNTTYFDIAGPEVSKDEQYWCDDYYIGTTVEGGTDAAFGVNHGTGHIKAYPAFASGHFGNYVRAVRGDESYGVDDFVDKGDGTVTDRATGLMWQMTDSGTGMEWEDALAYADSTTTAGYDDWRLPNVKELQSIVDYTHSPSAGDAANLGPAIDTDFFDITELAEGTTDYDPDYGYYWTSTSAIFGPGTPYYYAWYVAFGTSSGADGADMHGAGAVRFDTKYEGGAQGEGGERYYNCVRLVRDAGATGADDPQSGAPGIPNRFDLCQNYPNPFNPVTSISYTLPSSADVDLSVYNLLGQRVKTLFQGTQAAGQHEASWDGTDENGMKVASSIYLCQVIAGNHQAVRKMSLMR